MSLQYMKAECLDRMVIDFMKIVVVGANGQIGNQLVHLIKEDGQHNVIAMVRKEEQVKSFENSGIQTVLANLEDSVENLVKAIEGSDAICFTAGSGGSTGHDKTLLIDLDGAVKMMEAAEKAGIKRFILVSALQANNRENWSDEIKPYYVAKHYADRILENSPLTYTIIRPGGLLNEPGNGKIRTGDTIKGGTIPREDVARTIFASLTNEASYNRSFDLISGDTPIDEALNQL
jgi:uncharacterized protein YbjT (DUF2867 family)